MQTHRKVVKTVYLSSPGVVHFAVQTDVEVVATLIGHKQTDGKAGSGDRSRQPVTQVSQT